MLFGCKNSEIGIFLDNFHKIYQNGNYKREVIEMVTRMKYLQKLLDWKDEKVIKVITGIRGISVEILKNIMKSYRYTIGKCHRCLKCSKTMQMRI